MIKLTFEIIGALAAMMFIGIVIGGFVKAASWADADRPSDDHRWDDR